MPRFPVRRRAIVAVGILVCATPALAAADDAPDGRQPDDEHYALRAEVGLEGDSNVHRTESYQGSDVAPVRSLLERIVVGGTISDAVADDQSVSVSATGAGKLFDRAAARDEDVAIAQSSAAWKLALSPRAALTLSGYYYEAFQRAAASPSDVSDRRDFRSLAPALALGFSLSPSTTLLLAGGYRWLVFKPDRDFDFQAPSANLDLRWGAEAASGAEWELGGGAGFERRAFGGPAYARCVPPSTSGLPCPGPDARNDNLALAHLDVTRTGAALLGAGYAFVYNASNSYGETVMRHFAIARFATALPLQLYLAAKGELLISRYKERVEVAAGSMFLSFEDENRSNLRVDLSREIGERLRVLARYTLYTNEIGANAGSYLRQTLLLSLVFGIEK